MVWVGVDDTIEQTKESWIAEQEACKSAQRIKVSW